MRPFPTPAHLRHPEFYNPLQARICSEAEPTVFSLRNLISPARRVEFALLQTHAERVLDAWARVITESNEINGRPAVEASQVGRYLCYSIRWATT